MLQNSDQYAHYAILTAMLAPAFFLTATASLILSANNRLARVVDMLNQHDAEGFGGCQNIGECAAVCPKEIPLDVISQLNADLARSWRRGH